MTVSHDWKFTVTLPELARMLALPEQYARLAGDDCRGGASVEIYMTEDVQRKFGFSDLEMLAMFRQLG
jgi:hypothetical protein